ncbi:MAG: hypothetical protein IPN80_14040 [Flavobacterium sp.]|nr:hypothetical protein [Flavobacterium sp.]
MTIGNYFSQTGGIGPVGPTITTQGVNTIYVYAETTAVPACEYEISFTVDIQPELVAPVLDPVTSCQNYDLQPLTAPFNYYTGPGGTGTMYTGLDVNKLLLRSTNTLYLWRIRIVYLRKHF